MEETPSLSPDEAHNILGVILENNTVIKPEQNVHNKKETDMIKELRIKNRLATNTERRHGTVYRRTEKGPNVHPRGAAGLKPGVATQQSLRSRSKKEEGRAHAATSKEGVYADGGDLRERRSESKLKTRCGTVYLAC